MPHIPSSLMLDNRRTPLPHPTVSSLVEYVARDLAYLSGHRADTFDHPSFERHRNLYLKQAEQAVRAMASWAAGVGSERLVTAMREDAGLLLWTHYDDFGPDPRQEEQP